MVNHYLVTGASRGIGKELVKSLAEKGHSITVVSRNKSRLTSLRGLYPENVFTLPLDITSDDANTKIIEHLNSRGLKLDGIVHNAGLLINKTFPELTNNDWQKQIDVNLLAPVKITRELLPFLKPHSHILNISSMGGFQGSSKFPGLAAYSASKGALSILTECLAIELSDQQIACNCLCLGAVQTEMLETAFPGMNAPIEPGEMGAYICDFLIRAHKFYNGKVLPVSLADPS